MKLILITLYFLFLFQNFTKADDIRDFQIEGMSIGDSLLNYMSLNDIENKSSDTTFYKNNKYKYYFYPDLDFLKIYDHLQVTVRPNDKRYILEGIDGVLDVDIEDCYKKIEKMKDQLNKLFSTNGKYDKGNHPGYKDSTYVRYLYMLPNGKIDLVCFDMGKQFEKLGKLDSLYVTMNSYKFSKFLLNEAYK